MLQKRKGKNQQKILLLLLAGVSITLSHSPRHHKWVLKELNKELKNIKKENLDRAIESLYKSKFVEEKNNLDGTTTLILNEKGKKLALTYDIENMYFNKPLKWDKKWRIISFDIPEKYKFVRNILRSKIKDIGFFEFQKSVFIFPYDCKKEIEYLIEFYNIRKFIRFIVAVEVDNELHLKQRFKLEE